MYTVVKLIELRTLLDEPLSVARAALPTAPYLTATEFCPWDVKGKVMRVLVDQHRDQDVDLVDGIKVNVDGGFVLVRPDPDAPTYQIVASVPDEAMGRELLEEYTKRVRAAQGSSRSQSVVPDTAPLS
jgi:mannose-1-phosphate guanylyltransferase/phosphomannomutase